MEYLVTQTGLYDHLRENRIAFIDLNQDDVADVPLRSRFTGLDSLALPVELLQSDFIVSMPKLKTHHWAGITASMKNLFGTVPGAVYGWPKNILHRHGIDNSIVDLNATIRPHFAIVDAVVAMEGDGPIMGRPRQLGCVIMGSDLVAVDATSARMIGLDPTQLPYLREAGRFLGHLDAAPYRAARRDVRAIRHRVRRARSLQVDPAPPVLGALLRPCSDPIFLPCHRPGLTVSSFCACHRLLAQLKGNSIPGTQPQYQLNGWPAIANAVR